MNGENLFGGETGFFFEESDLGYGFIFNLNHRS